mmetsp:Transcript_34480/g.78648  ORF Transcript_34480/g.78648 Transcript_34480/m.78648 type:complete len:204 (+) Transcript_34480:190-801(+)
MDGLAGKTGEEATILVEERSEHQGDDGHQLHQNVDTGARGVLHGVTDRVTDNGSVVGIAALAAVVALLDVLLGVVPGSAGVGHGDGNLDTRHHAAAQEAGQAVFAEEEADEDGGEDDEGAGAGHLLEGRLGGDDHAALVVGLGGAVHDAGNFTELTAHLLDHGAGSETDGLHGHGGEPVGVHDTDDEAGEDEGVLHVEVGAGA